MATLMIASEVAAHYRVSIWTVYAYAKAGMPHTRFGNRMLFDPERVEAYLRAQRERREQRQRGATATTTVAG